ncbi:MAG TPA: CoA transferase [Hyphomicrobiaceae bacterium]|nr:CoA transferase [Hyphomicrobiaceae bacterium]
MTAVPPRNALADLWAQGGGDPSALASVQLTGQEPALPSSYPVGTIAQATIAASALAAAELWRLRTGARQDVSVDMRHAAIEFRSERYLSVEGANHRTFDPLFGVYRAGDGRYVRIHTNFPHHRDGMLKMLGADSDRASVAKAIAGWNGQAFEDAAAERGLVATMTRSLEEWAAHPQEQAIAALPALEIVRIGEGAPRDRSGGVQPLSGVRVLDLTRVIAGPVCGRTLASHGADVLGISGPSLPSAIQLVMDNGRGKLQAHIELNEAAGRETLAGLAKGADVFVQGYRPGAIASKGFSPERLAEINPGIVCVSLCAWGHVGPWSGRRGFDSLVQNANGLNIAEAVAAGSFEAHGPKELPAQALDHASGFLMATGAMLALKRQAEEGGSWLVRISLAQTGEWLKKLGRLPDGLSGPEPSAAQVAQYLETSPSGFGRLTAVRHSGLLSATPARWTRPSVPLGTHPAAWPQAA